MEKIKITVIIPIYNSEKYLVRCLDSIINQSLKEIQIILINDGSNDKSGEICDQYCRLDSRVNVIHKKNEGVSVARNIGIRLAKGEYIIFIDSDDWIEKEMLKRMLDVIEKENVDVVKCDYKINSSNNHETKNKSNIEFGLYNKDKINNELLPSILNNKLRTYVYLLLIRKDIIYKNEIYFNENITMMEDFLFYLELLTNSNNWYVINDYLYHYFENISGITKSNRNNDKKINSVLNVYIESNKILKKTNGDIIIDNFRLNLVKLIDTYFYRQSYKLKTKDNDNLYDFYKTYANNYVLNNMINSIDFAYLPLHKKISIKLFKKKKIYLLIMYYKFKFFVEFIFNKKHIRKN